MADVEVPVEEVKEKKKKKSSLKKSSIPNLNESPADSNSTSKSSSRKQSKIDSEPEIIDKIAELSVQSEQNASNKTEIDQTIKKIHFDEPYKVPREVRPHDLEALKDIDERKLVELKEAFKIFDFDNDGIIDAGDLKAMFKSLGQEISEKQVEDMLDEAMNPLDFDSFVVLLGYRTIDLDPEDVLLEALSKWDKEGNGLISEEVLRHDLMSFGDKFSEKEVNYALEEAPIAKGTGEGFKCSGPVMIDYPEFCKSLCGLRKRMKK